MVFTDSEERIQLQVNSSLTKFNPALKSSYKVNNVNVVDNINGEIIHYKQRASRYVTSLLLEFDERRHFNGFFPRQEVYAPNKVQKLIKMIPDEKLKSILEEVARYFNFKSWTHTQKQLNETIENYFGVLIPITINGIGQNGEEKRSVFVKIPPIEQPDALKPVIRQHYEVEIYTYSTLVPIYRSITTVNMSKLIPECYHASLEKNNEVLVLQDMRYSGYRKHAGEMLFDFEHVVLSIKTLAKFHCLSMVLKEKGFDFDVDVMKPYTSSHPELYYTYIKNTLERNMHIFKNSKHQVYLKTLMENLDSHIESSISEASYLVYSHGDFWRENILFKYENDKPIEACLLDFQKSRIMSPAQDILLFLLGNIEAALSRKHHQYFLDVYLSELHRNLEENGLNKIYLMQNLVQDMRIGAPYSIAITTMAYSLWLGLEDDGVVKSKNTCDGDDRKQTMLRFKTKVVDMLEDLVHFGYITL